MTHMNAGGPEWRKWCAEYEGSTRSERERSERRVRRDLLGELVATDYLNTTENEVLSSTSTDVEAPPL